MKPLKLALLVVMMLVSLSNIKAQCIWAAYASPNGANVQFTAYIDSNNLSGSTYYWDFGDGDTSQSMYPSHTYTQSGTYNYCFHYSGFLCSQDSCNSVVVNICDFNPQISYSHNGLSYFFSGYHTSSAASYYWQVWDSLHIYLYDQPYNDTSSLSYTFPGYGYYYVRLLSDNGNNIQPCYDSTEVQVYVANPCAAHFNYGMADSTTAQFYPTPFDSLTTPTSQFSYAWTFGDGGTSSQYVPNHDFINYGTYNVCVTVTSANCTDTYCQQISVSPPPPPAYNIYGTINKGATHACASTIYLISDSSGFLSLVNSTYTIDSGGLNCYGTYSFYSVPQGIYYVKVALDSTDADYANYLPTYYGDVLNWSNATALTLNSHQYNIGINLTAGVNPGGPGFVGGWVSQGAGLTASGNNVSRAVGDPLPNIQINLLTVNDVPVASTHTDANGRYTFNNLALGTYKIYAEEINKIPSSQNVTLTANNPTQDNVDVTVNSNTAVTGIDDLRDIKVEGIYPNPVSDKATVTISLQQNSKVTMTLTDVNGRLLQSKNLDLTSGANQLNLDLSNEAFGIYHLSLTNHTSKKIIRIVKTM